MSDEAREADEAPWEALRLEHFSGERLNLNPGTLGTPSADVRRAMTAFREEDGEAYPLGRYTRGRAALRRARALAESLWGEAPAICGSASHTMNLIAWSLARSCGEPVPVLATTHEHHGAVAVFERDAAFLLTTLSPSQLSREEALRQHLRRSPPRVALFSQGTWTEGRRLPVEAWCRAISEEAPGCLRVVDAAQVVGLGPPALQDADVVVASAHKWLFGPAGLGFAWVSDRARVTLGELWRTGEPLDPGARLAGWEAAGGQDFALYAGLEAALALYARIGPARVRARSRALADWLAAALGPLLPDARVEAEDGVVRACFAGGDPYPLYVSLNVIGIHCKCIKSELADGERLAVLRFGLPWYETRARLGRLLEAVQAADPRAREPGRE